MCHTCGSELIPIIYGELTNNIIDIIDNGSAVYGGIKQEKESPLWYCFKCLEDIIY